MTASQRSQTLRTSYVGAPRQGEVYLTGQGCMRKWSGTMCVCVCVCDGDPPPDLQAPDCPADAHQRRSPAPTAGGSRASLTIFFEYVLPLPFTDAAPPRTFAMKRCH